MKIKRVACVGAGLIGHGWAALFATKGFSVVLYARSDATLLGAIRDMKSDLEFLARKDLIERNDVGDSMARVETATDLTKAVEDADYVQESVVERYDVKKTIFKEMDASAPEHAILASSSSGLLITEIQKVTRRPQRCVVVNPAYPLSLMPLVEIMGGENTSEETIQTTYKLMVKLGKTPVVVRKEVPGQIANRLQAAVLREAIDLVDKGVASVEDVDRAIRVGPGLRWAFMGPFLVHHLSGKGIERFFETLGPSYANRWKSMAVWTSVPPSAAKKVIDEVYQLEMVRSKTMEEIVEWRDDKLVEMLKLLGPATGKTDKKAWVVTESDLVKRED
jgi:3-hydroxypropionate dehydrogenase (NADP+)